MTATNNSNNTSGLNIVQRKQHFSDADSRKKMSCNGCRVLRKGCSDTCILRPCLQWIESPEAQGHATVFVAKFFGRAGLMAFISAVPDNQRPALFQSLLYEACGRTVNPVNGAVGLLWTGNWQVCQAAVDTVLKGGTLRPPQSPGSGIATCSTRPPLMNNHSANFRANEQKNNRQGIEAAKIQAMDGESREIYNGRSDLDFSIYRPQGGCSQQPWSAKVKPEPYEADNASVSEAFEVRHRQSKNLPEIVAPVARRVRQRTEGNESNSIISSRDNNLKLQGDLDGGNLEFKANLDLSLNGEYSSSRHERLWKQRVSSPSIVSVNSEGSVTSLESGSLAIPNQTTSSIAVTEHKVLALFP